MLTFKWLKAVFTSHSPRIIQAMHLHWSSITPIVWWNSGRKGMWTSENSNRWRKCCTPGKIRLAIVWFFGMKTTKQLRMIYDVTASTKCCKMNMVDSSFQLMEDFNGSVNFDFRVGDDRMSYWVSFLDGTQRVLLFTDLKYIVSEANSASGLEQVRYECQVTFLTWFEKCEILLLICPVLWQLGLRRMATYGFCLRFWLCFY